MPYRKSVCVTPPIDTDVIVSGFVNTPALGWVVRSSVRTQHTQQKHIKIHNTSHYTHAREAHTAGQIDEVEQSLALHEPL